MCFHRESVSIARFDEGYRTKTKYSIIFLRAERSGLITKLNLAEDIIKDILLRMK